jgi:Tfp pilus assembly protein PilF
MLVQEPRDVFLNYALALEYLKDPESAQSAEAQLRHVLTLDEAYVPAYYQLGKILEAQNKTSGALAMYRRGLEMARSRNDRKTANEFEEAIYLLEE